VPGARRAADANATVGAGSVGRPRTDCRGSADADCPQGARRVLRPGGGQRAPSAQYSQGF